MCKDCRGSNFCSHGRVKRMCKDCGGSSLCAHGRQKSRCKDCGGTGLCPHDRRKDICKACNGVSICPHGKRKNICKTCGGSEICPHNKIKSRCKTCDGYSFCNHNKRRSICPICSPDGHLSNIVRSCVHNALKENKEEHSVKYLGCTIKCFKIHLEEQFEKGMSWDNYGDWEIDHVIPLKYKENGEKPSLDDVIERLYYKNTQPMWKDENMSKGNKYIGKKKNLSKWNLKSGRTNLS